MMKPHDQLDRRFETLRPLLIREGARPARGWVHAIRKALGMTTAQLARRMGVQQPRVVELERGEASGNISLRTLERAAEAMGCRFVYFLLPEKPLSEMLEKRAADVARAQLAYVSQSMKLEGQAVEDGRVMQQAFEEAVAEFLRHPSQLWKDGTPPQRKEK